MPDQYYPSCMPLWYIIINGYNFHSPVPLPPHKKKQKLHTSGSGGQAASQRNSGPSETSSEVDSAVDSPDLTEAASDSLVSHKVNINFDVFMYFIRTACYRE